MKKIIAIIIIILVIAVIALISTKEEKNEYVVKVGHLQIMASKLPFEIAKQKGFFEEEGIKIEATELQSSNLLLDALIRGDVDVTPEISLFPYMSAELVDPGKMKIFSVTDATKDAPFDSIMVKSDSSIKTINDLPGKKLGVSPGTTATAMMKLFLKGKGVDTSTIEFIQLAPTAQLTGLSSGAIDALFTYEPVIAIATKSQNMRVIFGSVFAEIVDHNPLGGGLITTKFASEHPEEAKKVVVAINKSYDFIKNNPDETRKIMAEVFNINNPDVIQAVSLTQFDYLENIDLQVMNQFLDSILAAGEIKSKPDLSNAFYK